LKVFTTKVKYIIQTNESTETHNRVLTSYFYVCSISWVYGNTDLIPPKTFPENFVKIFHDIKEMRVGVYFSKHSVS